MNKFHIRQRSLIEQISGWQTTFANKPSPVPSYKDKPLVGLYEIFKSRLSDDEITEAIEQLRAVTNEQAENFAQSYSNFIDALIDCGNKLYASEDRIYFRCRSRSHIVWIIRDMSALTSFPICFKCQVESLVESTQRTTDRILEPELD